MRRSLGVCIFKRMTQPMGTAQSQPAPALNNLWAGAVGKAVFASVKADASDIHLRAGEAPWVRKGGDFGEVPEFGEVTEEEMAGLFDLYGSLVDSGKDLSVTIEVGESRWRLTAFQSSEGINAALRQIPSELPVLRDLGVPDSVRSLAFLKSGLIVIAGATGSGKSTTAAAILNVVNHYRAAHILTIENPIEHRFPKVKARVTQQHVPDNESDHALALAMRSDPNVVLMAECIRASHFEACMRLAETGHLVITTLHARNTVSVCQRISTACGPEGRESLSNTLRAVLAQQLISDAADSSKRHLAYEIVEIDHPLRGHIGPDGKLKTLQQEIANRRLDMDYTLAQLVLDQKINHASAIQAAFDQARFSKVLSYLTGKQPPTG